jgi:uncharacterized integral membrane protein
MAEPKKSSGLWSALLGVVLFAVLIGGMGAIFKDRSFFDGFFLTLKGIPLVLAIILGHLGGGALVGYVLGKIIGGKDRAHEFASIGFYVGCAGLFLYMIT